MNRKWASLPTATPADEFLREVHAGLLVRTIATLRDDLETLPENSPPERLKHPKLDEFDFIPATAAGRKEIVGIYKKVRDKRVFEPLRESFLVAANSSLIEFIRTADSRPFALLVDNREIFGLVTHADLQRLPVYTAIFAVISAVEMQLIAWIRLATKGDERQWIDSLSAGDRHSVETRFKSSQHANVALDLLSATTLEQEVAAARYLKLIEAGKRNDSLLGLVIDCRNSVFHCKEIALDSKRIKDLARAVNAALELSEFLTAQLKKHPQ